MSGDASPKVFREPEPRSHAAWASAGVLGYWAVLTLSLYLTRVDAQFGEALALAWGLVGLAAAPCLTWRADLALAARRGDRRRLASPLSAVFAAYFGSLVGMALGACVGASLSRSTAGWLLSMTVAATVSTYGSSWILGDSPWPRVVEVGCDAVRYTSGRSAEDIPWREIASVARAGDVVVIRRRGRPDVAVDLGSGAVAAALVVELNRALSAAREPPAVASSLRRDGFPVARWREALRAKTLGANDFRAQALDRDALVAALTHPAATPEERVGAALALRDLDDEGVSRIRVAAEGVLHHETRQALRAVADGRVDDRAIERATRGG